MEKLPPWPDDAWGRFHGRPDALRDVWVRPRDRVEHHPAIELLSPVGAAFVLHGWARDDFALLERIHERAVGLHASGSVGAPHVRDPDEHRAAILGELEEAFRSGWLVMHVAERAASGAQPSTPSPPARSAPPPGTQPGAAPIPLANLVVHVRTPDGKVIAGATVNIAGASSRTAQSDGSGTARFDRIAPGSYAIDGARAGHVEGSSTAIAPPGSTTVATVILIPITLEIVDDSGVVLDAARTWIVGERVVLTARSKPAGRSLTSITWVVPGEIVAAQSYTSTAGTITSVPASAFHEATMRFHWIAGHAPTQLRVQAVATGVAISASLPFSVLAPTGVALVGKTSSVNVGPDSVGDLALCFWEQTPGSDVPSDGASGITFDGKLTPPAGGSGTVALLQLIRSRRTQTRTSGATRMIDSGAVFWLDDAHAAAGGGVFMAVPLSAPASVFHQRIEYDSPGNTLAPDDVESTASDSFKTYLMYRPDADGSIWVTVARVSWSWAGRAVRDDTTWRLTESGHLRNPVGARSSDLPSWSEHFRRRREEDWR